MGQLPGARLLAPVCRITSDSTGGLGTLPVSSRAPATPIPPAPTTTPDLKVQDSRVHRGKTASCPHHDAGHSPSSPGLSQLSPAGGWHAHSLHAPSSAQSYPPPTCHHLGHPDLCTYLPQQNPVRGARAGTEPQRRGNRGTEVKGASQRQSQAGLEAKHLAPSLGPLPAPWLQGESALDPLL